VYLVESVAPATQENMSFTVHLEDGSVTNFSQSTQGSSDYTSGDITVESVGDCWRISCTLID